MAIKTSKSNQMTELEMLVVEFLRSKEPLIYPTNVQQIREVIERIAFDDELEVLLEE